jgi:hypothetical protein
MRFQRSVGVLGVDRYSLKRVSTFEMPRGRCIDCCMTWYEKSRWSSTFWRQSSAMASPGLVTQLWRVLNVLILPQYWAVYSIVQYEGLRTSSTLRALTKPIGMSKCWNTRCLRDLSLRILRTFHVVFWDSSYQIVSLLQEWSWWLWPICMRYPVTVKTDRPPQRLLQAYRRGSPVLNFSVPFTQVQSPCGVGHNRTASSRV